MPITKKSLLICLLIIVISSLVFVYNNWSMWQYKIGNKTPIIYLLDTSEDEARGKTFLLKNNTKWISDFKFGLTDFYYAEGVNSISFGLWYKKWDYNAIDKIFNITMKDNYGNNYESFFFTILPSVGVYETFQIREIRGINIHDIQSLTINFSLENQAVEDVVSLEIYNKNTHKLEQII